MQVGIQLLPFFVDQGSTFPQKVPWGFLNIFAEPGASTLLYTQFAEVLLKYTVTR